MAAVVAPSLTQGMQAMAYSLRSCVFKEEDGTKVETSVTCGNSKLQWKCDWAMCWSGRAGQCVRSSR
jgi:lysyl-tRNA synthetase class I